MQFFGRFSVDNIFYKTVLFKVQKTLFVGLLKPELNYKSKSNVQLQKG